MVPVPDVGGEFGRELNWEDASTNGRIGLTPWLRMERGRERRPQSPGAMIAPVGLACFAGLSPKYINAPRVVRALYYVTPISRLRGTEALASILGCIPAVSGGRIAMQGVLRHIRKMARQASADSQSDAQLLEAFLARRDEEAIAALVRRHGPMVLGVCRRVLRHTQDAEDAFQATFLVLVRKASSLRSELRLGNWLYGVAYRTAMKARAMRAKRQIKERRASAAAECASEAQCTWDGLLDHLDAELSRLPEKYRVPVVLCELQGTPRKKAARLLGLPEGTLSWRLARARKLLAARLARHRVALPAGALLAVCADRTSACVPPSLLAAVTRASVVAAAGQPLGAGMVSARVISLTEGVLKAMLLTKLKVVGTLLLAVSLTAATGLTYRATAADDKPRRDAPQVTRPAQSELEALRLEIEALRKTLQATRDRVGELELGMRAIQQASRESGDAKLAPKMQFAPGTKPSKPNAPGTKPSKPGPQPAPGRRAQDKQATLKALEQDEKQPLSKARARLLDVFAEAEQALGELRKHPGNEELAKRLERALEQIRQRTRPEGRGPRTGSTDTSSGAGGSEPNPPAPPRPPATPAGPRSPRPPAPPDDPPAS
jgi:RNA polymerase sigma factor (sigma-70 family)